MNRRGFFGRLLGVAAGAAGVAAVPKAAAAAAPTYGSLLKAKPAIEDAAAQLGALSESFRRGAMSANELRAHLGLPPIVVEWSFSLDPLAKLKPEAIG